MSYTRESLQADCHRKKSDFIKPGMIFGCLTVLSGPCKRCGGTGMYECRCVCGRIRFLVRRNLELRIGRGCVCVDRHGQASSLEYRIWRGIIQRCTNPNRPAYQKYGARGIIMCDRWRSSFETFISDMGPRPSRQHSVDRIDNDGNYEPGNCRWATREEQCRNKSSNRLMEFQGRMIPVSVVAELTGIRAGMLFQRINAGWSDYEAVIVPPRVQVKTWRKQQLAGGVGAAALLPTTAKGIE